MKETIEKSKMALSSHRHRNDADLDQFLNDIEKGGIPEHLLLNGILELVIKLDERMDKIEKRLEQFPQLTEIKRQVEEIHKLHFATEHLEKGKSLKDKFLAEILISNHRRSL